METEACSDQGKDDVLARFYALNAARERREREAVEAAYRAALAAGQPITGAELGRRFGLSDRWGRARVAEVRRNPAADDGGAGPSNHPAPPQDARRAWP